MFNETISLQNKQTCSKHLIFILNTLFILIISGSTPIITNDYFHIIVFIFLSFIYFSKGYKIDSITLIILTFWFIINLFAYYVNLGIEYSVLTLGGVTIKILYPYFLIRIIGPSFFEYLQKYIYYLVIISLIIYLIDIIFPLISTSFNTILNFMSYDEQKQAGGWYIFVYMHNNWAKLQGFDVLRNSGFMWEPGAFSLVLIFATTLHFCKNNFVWDLQSLIYSFAIITTFSTAGYISLTILILTYLIFKRKEKKLLYLFLFPILIYSTIILFQLDFVGGKLIEYSENINVHYTHEGSGVERVNRIAILMYTLEHTFHWPFGNGIFDSLFLKDKYGFIFNGPNVFAGILHKWGVFGLIYLLISLVKFYMFFYTKSKIIPVLFSISISITLFSNPMVVQILVYAITYYYIVYIFNKKSIKPTIFHKGNLSFN